MENFLKLFFLIALLSGCSLYQITSEETTFDNYPPKSSSRDVLYLEQITRPYQLIGYVKVNAERSQKKEEIIEKLKHEAAAMGADAIANISVVDEEPVAKNKFIHLLENARLRKTYMADVLVFSSANSNGVLKDKTTP